MISLTHGHIKYTTTSVNIFLDDEWRLGFSLKYSIGRKHIWQRYNNRMFISQILLGNWEIDHGLLHRYINFCDIE